MFWDLCRIADDHSPLYPGMYTVTKALEMAHPRFEGSVPYRCMQNECRSIGLHDRKVGFEDKDA